MTSVDDKMMTLTKADVAELLVCVARVARETAETMREARENYVAYTSGAWKHVSCPMKPILFRKSRSEKDESDGGGGNKIEATLVVREARVNIGGNFDRCVTARG